MMKNLLFRITLVATLAACALSFVSGTRAAFAASPALDAAQQLYDGAKFNDAIAKLRDAISSGAVTGTDALKAKELLGRCLVKTGNRIDAKQQFKNLLRQDGGYRLDAANVPPDEMEVFELAAKEIQAEQIEAGQRIPASLSFHYGTGAGDNKDFGKLPLAGGGSDKFDSKPEFGGSVRFPLRPRWSLDIEMLRLRATSSDSFVTIPRYAYEATAIPLVVSLYWTAITGSKYRLNLFAGGGPMVASRGAIKLKQTGAGYFVADEKVGSYIAGGVEAEYLVVPKVSLTGRFLGRSAQTKDLFSGTSDTFYLYPGSVGKLQGQTLDFSGIGAFVGLRAYIGY